ncbi:mechanosensitive ion channel domain-containing protein [Allomuricauda sp.]|uniref:mechanosensitive ion channel family protein n=1 Tax=Flagellimonas alginolytica TaxID=3177515 RepID=UPI0025FD2422|nr:mechanosensitive ion channel domain-containing protein [Allomuricauda sp.]
METINNWKAIASESLSTIGREIATAFPKIFGAIIILIIGWLTIKIVTFLLKKVLKITKIDALNEKINDMEITGKSDFKIDLSKIVLGFAKWFLILVFLILTADILNFQIISQEIGNLLNYLPRFFSALVLLMVGFYIGSLVKKTVKKLFESFELGGSNLVSNLLFYIIVIFMSITALNQAGVDTTIITNNITMILGAFLLAFALGVGLGTREIIADIMRSFYTRKTYAVGDRIVIGDDEGTIKAIENNSLILETRAGEFVIPIKDVVSQKVQIKS